MSSKQEFSSNGESEEITLKLVFNHQRQRVAYDRGNLEKYTVQWSIIILRIVPESPKYN